jgi:hypothetical protein
VKVDAQTAVLAELQRLGLLLLQDPVLPSAVAILAGGPVRGSWWGHPEANDMFRILNEVTGDPEVLTLKLVGGKVTLVHRRLWPAVLVVALARERWQTEGLSAAARALLERVERGVVDTSGPPVKELEERLLVRAEQVHTTSGKHLSRLERWPAWASRVRCKPAGDGKQLLAEALAALGGKPGLLPWNRRTKARRLGR